MWDFEENRQPVLWKVPSRSRRFLKATMLTGMSLSVLGCAGSAQFHTPLPGAVAWEEIGVATWYGHPYHGRQAASGEIYDMRKLTAAHRTLPFGTLVRVHNLENTKAVDVKINDRGPFVDGKIIDLSRSAARVLGFQRAGQARVRLEVLSVPSAPATWNYAVQVGAFRWRTNAERVREEMERRYGSAVIVPLQGDPVLWRVIAGKTSSLEAAATLAHRIRSEKGNRVQSAFVVHLDRP